MLHGIRNENHLNENVEMIDTPSFIQKVASVPS